MCFANAGYPILLCLRARFWAQPVRKRPISPRITILVAAHNEVKNLPRKLANFAALDYPRELLDIIVVSDGSTDGTDKILESWAGMRHQAIRLPAQRGKAVALNAAMANAEGGIVVFTDVRQSIAPDALRKLVANFADPTIGCVSGELMLRKSPTADSSDGVGLYWRIEKNIRYWEGLTGSTIGATGALYAVRRELLPSLPADLILDDVYIPLEVVRKGQRVVFEPDAVVWDDFVPTAKQEFRRKLRTLFGNYQLLQVAPWTLRTSNPVLLEFVCHKLLRLLVPFALLSLLFSAFWLRNGVYGVALAAQLGFYALAGLGTLRIPLGMLSRLSNISLAFAVLNLAAALAFVHFILGRKVMWVHQRNAAAGTD